MPNKPPLLLLLLLLLGGGCEELGGWPAGLDLHNAVYGRRQCITTWC
jgi:hypothetical protein